MEAVSAAWTAMHHGLPAHERGAILERAARTIADRRQELGQVGELQPVLTLDHALEQPADLRGGRPGRRAARA